MVGERDKPAPGRAAVPLGEYITLVFKELPIFMMSASATKTAADAKT
jgi:hypothetical protein